MCPEGNENEKTPGNDGIPKEFYVCFWQDIKKYLLDSINFSIQSNQLSITQRQGIITLLPKPDKDLKHLKNWRPISLLNTDYKLITGAIAARIKLRLNKIISTNQTGFVKGRFIGENISHVLSLMDYCDENNIAGLFVSIDFEKAFDLLEWNFVIKCLKSFNFGPNIIKWINTIYCNISSCVINNGWYSCFFNLSRGMRQGCPLSPYLFIICVEILSIYINSHEGIKGITCGETEHKLSQYADDTALFLQYSEANLRNMIKTFDHFQQISGLKINKCKTNVMPFGALDSEQIVSTSDLTLQWSTDPIHYLGVRITPHKNILIDINYEPILNKMLQLSNIWSQRELTLFGKSVIIKSLLLSQLTFLMSVLPTPNEDYFNRANKIIFGFLWKNKPDKIKRNVLYNKKENGGLSLTHVKAQNTSLKIAWIKRLLSDAQANWKYFFIYYIQREINIRDFLLCNLGELDAQNVFKSERYPFVRDVFLSWFMFSYNSNPDEF